MQSDKTDREAILVYGSFGSGKTHNWAATAAMLRESGSPGTFRVINTPSSGLQVIDRIAHAYPGFEENVVWQDVYDWQGMWDLTQKYLAETELHDWIIIEGIDSSWQWVQDAYQDEWRANNPQLSAGLSMFAELPSDQDPGRWQKIKGVRTRWLMDILRSPAHVYATAPQDAIQMPRPDGKGWKDDQIVIEQYGGVGFKPEGEKHTGHVLHSILWARQRNQTEWTLTTVDDAGRDYLKNQVITSFPIEYLVRIAGWTLCGTEEVTYRVAPDPFAEGRIVGEDQPPIRLEYEAEGES